MIFVFKILIWYNLFGDYMSIRSLRVKGIRSFKFYNEIKFSTPDFKNNGSGLNVLVGPNNSGKSSIIETLFIANKKEELIPENIRNKTVTGGIKIELKETNGNKRIIENNNNKSAFVDYKYIDKNGEELPNYEPFAYILPQKRNIQMNFYGASMNRFTFEQNNGGISFRNIDYNSLNGIGGRFIDVFNNYKDIFNWELEYILGYLPNWYIDSTENSSLNITFQEGKYTYKSQSCGDGFINIFVILTAIYDANKNTTIVIDEPEVAIHPDVQKRLMERLLFHSKDKQIIISTHSPYFVDLDIVTNGGNIFRLCKENGNTHTYSISSNNIEKIKKLKNDAQQPYLTYIKSKEVFFLDKTILVEGIEDIFGYKNIFKKYNYTPRADFYGWGIGGAERLKFLVPILQDLGYKKVFTILDGDKIKLRDEMSKQYPNYKFCTIDADDIRDKDAPNIKHINAIINKIIKSGVSQDTIDSFDKFKKEYIDTTSKKGVYKDIVKEDMHEEYEDNIKYIISECKNYFKDKKTKEYVKFAEDSDLLTAKRLIREYINSHPEKTVNYLKSKYYEFEEIGSGGEQSDLELCGERKYSMSITCSNSFNEIGDKKASIYLEVDLNNMINPVTINNIVE